MTSSLTALARTVFLGGTLILLSPRIAWAHGGGAISLDAKQAQPGGKLVVRGEQFGKGSSLRLELRGILKNYNLGRVAADTSGKFDWTVLIPADAGVGQYTIAAIASDGDMISQASLMLVLAQATGAGAVSAHPGMHDMPGMSGMGGPHASAEKMDIPRTVTTTGLAVIALIVLASALAGFLLIRGTAGAARQV